MSPSASSLRKWPRRLAIAGLVALLAVLATYFALAVWGKRNWEQTKRELLAKGEKLTLQEQFPPPVPEAENFFAVPLWEDVLELEQKPNESGRLTWTARKPMTEWRLNVFKNALSGKEGAIFSHLAGSLEKGTPRNFDAAAAFLREQQLAPTGLGSLETIQAALARANQELAELREAARRPRARLTYYPEDNFLFLPLNYLTPSLKLAQYLGVHSATEAAKGNGPVALENVQLLLRLADSFQSDPLLISQLVRVSILGGAAMAVWDGLTFRCWNEPELAKLDQRLAAVDLSRDFVTALRGERGSLTAVMEGYARKGGLNQFLKDIRHSTSPSPDGLEQFFTFAFSALYPQGLWHENLAIYNRLLQEVIEYAEAHPFTLASGAEIEAKLSEMQSPKNRLIYPLVTLALPSLTAMQGRFTLTETRLRQARIAIALERFRLAKGELPETLDALVPTFLPSPLLDPVNAEPFSYQRTGPDQFKLWSVGGDRVNDQGEPSSRSGHTAAGDWVWQTASGPVAETK